ncbi:hypothetical protein HKD37_15G043755 [Glycine soja]
MRATARIISEIEEVHEQMKADMEAMKEQMTMMMEAMMSMRKMMEDNTATVVVASTATKMDPIHLTGFNQVNRRVLDVVAILQLHSLRIRNPNLIMHMSLNPWGKHMKFPKTTLWLGSGFIQDIPLKDLVFAGERIEVGLRRGKFDYAATASSSNRRARMSGRNKKEGETHVVTTVPTWPNFSLAPLNAMYQYPPQQYQYSTNISPSHYSPSYQPRTPNQPQRPPLNQPQNPLAVYLRPKTTPNTNQNNNQGRNFPEKKPVEFTPIPISYADLLPYLLDNAMVVVSPSKIPQPPFPRGYDSNVTCAYHGGVPRHSIEHFMTLKHKVQSLIDAGWLTFEEENRL